MPRAFPSDAECPVAQRKALPFRLVEAGNMADRARSDQRLHDGGAERAGAAGNDNLMIAKVHRRQLQ